MHDPTYIDFIDIKETCRTIGGKNKPVNPSTYYRGVKAGIYPTPDHPSPGISRVNRSALLTALRNRMGATEAK